jgi:hypothetical protein
MGRRVRSGKKKRFTVWLPDDVLEDLARQQDATGKGSIAEVLREAVASQLDKVDAPAVFPEEGSPLLLQPPTFSCAFAARSFIFLIPCIVAQKRPQDKCFFRSLRSVSLPSRAILRSAKQRQGPSPLGALPPGDPP